MRQLLLLFAALGLAGLLSAQRDGTTDAHQSWSQGDCASCHTDAPTTHREAAWQWTHGRADSTHGTHCGSCHARAACRDCHQRRPSNHTPGFLVPDGQGLDSQRHAVLARARPSACLACHRSFAAACTGCHALGEVEPWWQEARRELDGWQGEIGELP